MEPRPASPCAEHTLRQGLLISALLLIIWNPLTTAQLTIESVPRHAVEGQNLLLQVHNLPDNIQGYFWFKGETGDSNEIVRFVTATNAAILGPANTGRETIQPNGSLLIVNVTMKDTGVYIFQTLNMDLTSEDTTVEIHVYDGPDVPIMSPPGSYFRLGTNLTLSCYAASNPPAQYSWLINEEPRSSSQELFIPNITTEHSGSYTRLVHNSDTGLKKTTVKNVTVLEPVTEPSIKATNTTVPEHGSVTFICLSNDTEISIQWIFNNQNLPSTPRVTLSNDNRSLSIDPVTREDTGDYQCEISNPVSSMKSNTVYLAVITEEGGLPVWAVVITVTGVLVLILVTALGCFLFLTKTTRARVQHDLRDPQTPASNSRPGASNSYALAHVSSHREATPVYQELVHPDMNVYDQINYTADPTS